MNVIERWQDRRNRKWWAAWLERHRWTELGDYNARLHRGIVHTPEYAAQMAEEQAKFDAETGFSSGFPITLEPRP